MKYIEVSRKIKLTREASQDDLKKALLTRLRRAFDVDALSESTEGFHLEATTGGPNTITRHARLSVDVNISKSQENARIIIHGHMKAAMSLLVSYTVLFMVVLFAGLLPGSIETSGERSGALDALVFLFFGIFIFYDVQRKVTEPREYLESALDSLDVEFG